MTKGGARVPSDIFAVGKGMGLDRHYVLLLLINSRSHINIKESTIELNKKFAWWDDPNANGPTETCRSYLKEMWRLGLIERISLKKGCVIPITLPSWNGGEQPPTYRMSNLGKFVLSQNKNLFPYYVAWCIINAYKNGIYPQVDKLIKLSDLEGYIPVNDDAHVELTKKHNLYVEKHAGKAIKFGWLEPTGLIFRSDKDKFKVNKKFILLLSKIKTKDLFNGIKKEFASDIIRVNLTITNLGLTSFKNGSKYEFNVNFENMTNEELTLSIKPFLFSLFSNNSNLTSKEKLVIKPKNKEILNILLASQSIDLSDSLMPSCIGFLEFEIKKIKGKIYLPEISIMHEDHIWELSLCDLISRLDLQVFHLTGKSDRPDAVIDLSSLISKPTDLLSYLRDSNKEKMLMETTLGEYSGTKLVDDTINTNEREFTKYTTHTQYVLKISAVGQLIAADNFSKNISEKFKEVKSKSNHMVTLIDKETLLYLIGKYRKKQNKTKVINILKSGKIIDKKLIDSVLDN